MRKTWFEDKGVEVRLLRLEDQQDPRYIALVNLEPRYKKGIQIFILNEWNNDVWEEITSLRINGEGRIVWVQPELGDIQYFGGDGTFGDLEEWSPRIRTALKQGEYGYYREHKGSVNKAMLLPLINEEFSSLPQKLWDLAGPLTLPAPQPLIPGQELAPPTRREPSGCKP